MKINNIYVSERTGKSEDIISCPVCRIVLFAGPLLPIRLHSMRDMCRRIGSYSYKAFEVPALSRNFLLLCSQQGCHNAYQINPLAYEEA